MDKKILLLKGHGAHTMQKRNDLNENIAQNSPFCNFFEVYQKIHLYYISVFNVVNLL